MSFIEVAEQLKDEFRLISIDAPGHGRTDHFVICIVSRKSGRNDSYRWWLSKQKATLPMEQSECRDLLARIFQQKTGGEVKLIPNITHMLHWDNPVA